MPCHFIPVQHDLFWHTVYQLHFHMDSLYLYFAGNKLDDIGEETSRCDSETLKKEGGFT
jgi:hypothetical protein